MVARLPQDLPSGRPIPITPTAEAWAAMSPEQRLAFQVAANEALTEQRRAMTEGRRHKRAKERAIDLLGLHFRTMGRVVYLAEEMTALYPGEEAFTPDILAVLDVPEPEDDPRMSWSVTDEGRGLDFVLEVLYRGDREKDLTTNVERYARLGIPEYFVYDRLRQRLHAHRLPGRDARRYERIVPQAGRFHSSVLGLDLAIGAGKLQIFEGSAELFGTVDLIGRLQGMVDDLEVRAEQAEAEAEQAKAEHAKQAEQLLSTLREGILGMLEARAIPIPEDVRSRIRSCADPEDLRRWLLRAVTASRAEDVVDPTGQATPGA